MQHLVGRVVACALDRAAQLAGLRPDEVDEGGLARLRGPGVGSGTRKVHGEPLRLPVQGVYKRNGGNGLVVGRIESGALRQGDSVVAPAARSPP